jgi:hypothetical protein
VGIDVACWLEEDLTDLLPVGGGYVPFTEPLDEILPLAHAHNVPVYPTISASGMRGRENRYSSVEAWRGAAANMWRAGADGIYTFNLFPPGPEPRFVELGSPETLAPLDKVFAIDNVAVLEGDLVQGIVQTQILPVAVAEGGEEKRPQGATLPIGDDLPAAARKGTLQSAVLRVQLSQPPALDAVEVRLNGVLLTPTEKDAEKGWLTFDPGPDRYRVGRNEVSFRAARWPEGVTGPVEVVVVEVAVDYK